MYLRVEARPQHALTRHATRGVTVLFRTAASGIVLNPTKYREDLGTNVNPK
jgi:hypothetical protein